MGYRSDVSVVFYTTNMEELPFSSLKFWFDESYPHKDAVEDYGATIETGDDYILVTYQSVKWYDGYRHVDAVRESLDTFSETFDADELDGLGAYELVEVGEEPTDIKDRRSNYSTYRLNTNTTIDFS